MKELRLFHSVRQFSLDTEGAILARDVLFRATDTPLLVETTVDIPDISSKVQLQNLRR